MHVHGSLRERNFNAFPIESREDSFTEFVLSQILIRELPYLADEREIERGFSKARDEPYERCGFSKQSGYLTDGRSRFFNEYTLNMIGINLV